MNLFEYAKLSTEKKEQVLLNQALFIENYQDEDRTVNVYFLDSFFVEITSRNGVVTDNIPYQRGYKVHPSKQRLLESRAFQAVAA